MVKIKDKRNEIIEKYQNVEMDSSAKVLMEEYDKILNGWDTGKAELEKKLENQGYEVNVYNPSKNEVILLALGSFIMLVYFSMYSKKI